MSVTARRAGSASAGQRLPLRGASAASAPTAAGTSCAISCVNADNCAPTLASTRRRLASSIRESAACSTEITAVSMSLIMAVLVLRSGRPSARRSSASSRYSRAAEPRGAPSLPMTIHRSSSELGSSSFSSSDEEFVAVVGVGVLVEVGVGGRRPWAAGPRLLRRPPAAGFLLGDRLLVLREGVARCGVCAVQECEPDADDVDETAIDAVRHEAFAVDERPQAAGVGFRQKDGAEEGPVREETQTDGSSLERAELVEAVALPGEERVELEPAGALCVLVIEREPVVARLAVRQDTETLKVDPDADYSVLSNRLPGWEPGLVGAGCGRRRMGRPRAMDEGASPLRPWRTGSTPARPGWARSRMSHRLHERRESPGPMPLSCARCPSTLPVPETRLRGSSARPGSRASPSRTVGSVNSSGALRTLRGRAATRAGGGAKLCSWRTRSRKSAAVQACRSRDSVNVVPVGVSRSALSLATNSPPTTSESVSTASMRSQSI